MPNLRASSPIGFFFFGFEMFKSRSTFYVFVIFFFCRSDFKEVVKLLETGQLGGGAGKYMDYDV